MTTNRSSLYAIISAGSCLLIWLLLLIIVCPHRLYAQKSNIKPYALIVGTVWGPDDRPVYGINVKIRRGSDKEKKVRWQLYSDHMGEFAQRVPAGESDYVIWADLKGVKTADGRPLHLVKEVTVHVYNDERQDVGLHLSY